MGTANFANILQNNLENMARSCRAGGVGAEAPLDDRPTGIAVVAPPELEMTQLEMTELEMSAL